MTTSVKKRTPDNCDFRIDGVDANFAPSVERLDIRYTILPPGAHSAKLEIFMEGSVSPVFADEWTTAGGSNIAYVQDGDELLLITQQGMILRMQANAVRAIGRATQGVKLIDIEGDDKVVSLAKLAEKEDDGTDTGGE